MKILLTRALNEKDEYVNIDSVPNGNKCGCVCPICRYPLTARNGEDMKKSHHFAHQPGSDCKANDETVLHKSAKDIIEKYKCVCLPNGECLNFDKVDVEFYDEKTKLRPDCIGYYEDKSLWIEFKRTHAITSNKRKKIIINSIDCIEIDLSKQSYKEESELRDFITNSKKDREWVKGREYRSYKKGQTIHSHVEYVYDDIFDCDVDFYDLKTSRTFAKDENGNLVNLRDPNLNVEEHTYYCLSCGKELNVERDSYELTFNHIESNVKCTKQNYLKETAKEIIQNRFYGNDSFYISILQYYTCVDKDICKFYNREKCVEQRHFIYDLKRYGYSECIKNYICIETNTRSDILIKNDKFSNNDIFIDINKTKSFVDIGLSNNRCIDINVYNEEDLYSLYDKILVENYSIQYNEKFKRNSNQLFEMNREIPKFTLYNSGKYYLQNYSCRKLDKKLNSVLYEFIFANGAPENNIGVEEFCLVRSRNLNMKACYCKICFLLGNGDTPYCKKYKTGGTPHYPLSEKEKTIGCSYFLLNRKFSHIESSIDVIER